MKLGKAAGLDGFTAEHLHYCNSILPCVLSKLFNNCMMAIGRVPTSFGQSYTVPILKTTVNIYSKSVSVDDFRGISISSVISEHCILDRYGGFLLTSDNQFGFKKKSSCAHAIYTMLLIIT